MFASASFTCISMFLHVLWVSPRKHSFYPFKSLHSRDPNPQLSGMWEQVKPTDKVTWKLTCVAPPTVGVCVFFPRIRQERQRTVASWDVSLLCRFLFNLSAWQHTAVVSKPAEPFKSTQWGPFCGSSHCSPCTPAPSKMRVKSVLTKITLFSALSVTK